MDRYGLWFNLMSPWLAEPGIALLLVQEKLLLTTAFQERIHWRYLPYIRPMFVRLCKGIYHPKYGLNRLKYGTNVPPFLFRILKFQIDHTREPRVKFPPFISHELRSLVDQLLQNLSSVAHVDSQGTWTSSANVSKASLVRSARFCFNKTNYPPNLQYPWLIPSWIDHNSSY